MQTAPPVAITVPTYARARRGSWAASFLLGVVVSTTVVSSVPVNGLMQNRAPHSLGLEPVLSHDRPHHLVEELTVLEQRSAEDAFLHGAELAQRAVAAGVLHDRAGFQPVDRCVLEREVEGHPRAREEEPCAPKR